MSYRVEYRGKSYEHCIHIEHPEGLGRWFINTQKGSLRVFPTTYGVHQQHVNSNDALSGEDCPKNWDLVVFTDV